MKLRSTSTPLARAAMTVALLVAAAAGQLSAQAKAALVIGNQAYSNLTQLKNPVNDATDVAEALRSLGFQVELLTDATLADMERQVVRLKSLLSGSSSAVGLFYYAGHGVQSEGVNYLIPADADILDEAFLKTKSLAVQSVLDALQGARNKLNVIVLDACRDNPFSWSRSGGRGLTVVGQQPPGSIIVYATSANGKAQDGAGRNGVFTAELLKNLKTPGTEIQEVFRRTGAGVQTATGGAQTPAIYNQFFGQYYLDGVAAVSAVPVTNEDSVPAAGTSTVAAQRRGLSIEAQGGGQYWFLGYFTVGIAGGVMYQFSNHLSLGLWAGVLPVFGDNGGIDAPSRWRAYPTGGLRLAFGNKVDGLALAVDLGYPSGVGLYYRGLFAVAEFLPEVPGIPGTAGISAGYSFFLGRQ